MFYGTVIFIVLIILETSKSENLTCEQSIHNQNTNICLTPTCIHTASDVLKNLDKSVDPCEDFYKFTCGGFIKRTNIPDDRGTVIPFSIIADQLIEQLRKILEEQVAPNESFPFLMLKKTYDICMDEKTIERDSIDTAKLLLSKIGGWPVLEGPLWNEKKFDWIHAMYKMRRLGLAMNSMIVIRPGADSRNSSKNIINCDQAQFGLDREHLIQGFTSKIVTAYYSYLLDIVKIFGGNFAQVAEELKQSVEFEVSLAKIALGKEDRRNMTALTHITDVSKLQEKYPEFPWLEYIRNTVNIPGIEIFSNETVDIGVPQFVTELMLLLNKTPKRVVANYIMYRTVLNMAPLLTKEIKERRLEFLQFLQGPTQMMPLWKQCVQFSLQSMRIAASAKYVQKFVNETAKINSANLVNYLRNEFINILDKVDWMDQETKNKAIVKAQKMESHIAYPDELLDNKNVENFYKDLKLVGNNFLDITLNISKFYMEKSYRALRKVNNRTDWTEHSGVTSVNAYYNIIENSIQLPAGILQEPFFGNDRPKYMNFGSMGFAIGHEITHGFDDVGRQYDEDGILIDWWGKETETSYIKKAQCIINQYSNYSSPDVNLNLNGINTLGENIADNAAVKVAYLAYERWIKENGVEPQLPGLNYTPKQMFWISAANLWCSKSRIEYLRQEILTDDHPPANFRVLGTLSNSDHFSRDFNCPIDSKMNSKHKCQVW